MKHKKRHYGRRKDQLDPRDYKFQAKPKPDTGLPMTYLYWKHTGVDVYDQGQLGSCVGNGVADLMEFAIKNDYAEEKVSPFRPSRLFIYYYARLLEGTISYDSGVSIRDGVKALANFGACSETIWPYDITRFAVQPSVQASREALLFKAIRYERIDNKDKSAIVGALAEGYPIAFGIDVYSSFESGFTSRTGDITIPEKGEERLGGHCMVIRGYDPGRPTRHDGKDYFYIKNSWGLEWGDYGHGRIPADYLTNPKLAGDFWIIKTIL